MLKRLKNLLGMKTVKVILGDEEVNGYLHRYQLFEFKMFLSCYIHRFNTKQQDRFHTHAFHAVAVVLKGGYVEEELIELRPGLYYKVTKTIKPGIRFIARKYNHKICASKPNTISILLCGPWVNVWTETFTNYTRFLIWGRDEIEEARMESKIIPEPYEVKEKKDAVFEVANFRG